jgi:hypothetical protein
MTKAMKAAIYVNRAITSAVLLISYKVKKAPPL